MALEDASAGSTLGLTSSSILNGAVLADEGVTGVAEETLGSISMTPLRKALKALKGDIVTGTVTRPMGAARGCHEDGDNDAGRAPAAP